MAGECRARAVDRSSVLEAGGGEPRHQRAGREAKIRNRRESVLAKKDKYIVGLDIGSTKTCVLLAEMDNDQLQFLALGTGGIQRAAERADRQSGFHGEFDSARGGRGRRRGQRASGDGDHWCGGKPRARSEQPRGSAPGPRPRDIERDDVRRTIDAVRECVTAR